MATLSQAERLQKIQTEEADGDDETEHLERVHSQPNRVAVDAGDG